MRVQKYKKSETDQAQQLDQYVVQIKREREENEKRKKTILEKERSRSWFGVRLGLVLGLGFGATSELVNVYLLPDIWVSAPPLGAFGNSILYGLFGAMVGWIIAQPGDTFKGVSLGCLAGLGVIEARAWLIPGATPMIKMMLNPAFFMFALVSFSLFGLLLIPVMLLWRSSIETIYELQAEFWWHWGRIRYALGMFLLALIAGSFFVYPEDTRSIIRSMDSLVQAGLLAANEGQLPMSLRTESARNIMQQKDKDYYLELIQSVNVDNETSMRSVFGQTGFGGSVSITAQFQGGWSLICTYQSPTIRPFCQGRAR